MNLLKNLLQIRQSKFGEFLNHNSVFFKMTEDQKNLFNMFMKEIKTGKGENLLKKGVIPKYCYLLKEGILNLKDSNNSSKSVKIKRSATLIGDFMGMLDKK